MRMWRRILFFSSIMRKRIPGYARSRSARTADSVAPLASASLRWVYERRELGMITFMEQGCLGQPGRFHGVDLRKVPGDARPATAFVAAHPQLAARRPEVQADGVLRVRRHRLTLHRPPRLTFRHAGVGALPGPAAVAGHVDRGNAVRARARPDGRAVHREHPHGVGIARVHHERKADVADALRHVLPDPYPRVRRPIEPVDAAVILLVQDLKSTRL